LPAAMRVGFLRDKKRFCKRFLSLKLPLENYNKLFEQGTNDKNLKYFNLTNEFKRTFSRHEKTYHIHLQTVDY